MKTEHSLSLLHAADLARDRAQWSEAVRRYKDHLGRHPDDSGIWIQLGNCLKEAGDLREAENAYRSSLKISPDSSDGHLQFGHLLKIAGRLSEAKEFYLKSFQVDGNINAQAELNALGGITPKASEPQDTSPHLILDCSDLIDYLRHNRLPTGIQRVQINIITGLIANEEIRSRVYIVFCHEISWRSISLLNFVRLVNSAQRTEDVDQGTWEGIRNQILTDASEATFVSESTLVNIGTSWWVPDYFLRIRHLIKKYAVKYVPFLHDCIPLVTPEYCSRGLSESFSDWFYETISYADRILVNSEATGRDVTKFGLPFRDSMPKPFVVQLDGDLRSYVQLTETASTSTFSQQLKRIGVQTTAAGRGNFVLFVSTLEVRKNHLLALRIWKWFLDTRPSQTIPHLLCVGKPGWHFDETLNYFDSHPVLKEKVIFLSGLDDNQLAEAYHRCLFTLYPSHYEGWGLPVTESLAFGRVPVISCNSSLPEAGGSHALYFDPLAPRQAYELVGRLIDDEEYRSGLEDEIARSFSPRAWEDIAIQLVTAVDSVRGESREQFLSPDVSIRCGQVYSISNISGGETAQKVRGDRLRDGLDWWPAERWGTWTREPQAQIAGRIQDGSGDIVVYIKLKAPPGTERFKVRLSMGSRPSSRWSLEPNETKWIIYKAGVIASSGDVVVHVEIDRTTSLALHTGGSDGRTVGVGVISVAFARPHVSDERVEILEQIVLGS